MKQRTFRILLAVCALLMPALVIAQPDLSGTWMLTGPGTESDIVLTDAGKRIQADYDLLADDPSLYCIPASSSRIWANPNAPIKIEQTDDKLLISYELFDLRREIPLGAEQSQGAQPSTRNLNGEYFAEMGSSVARYEGERLIIESRNHAAGYIRTSRGVPQSPTTLAIEEIKLDGDRLHITHTYIDEEIFEVPLVLEYFFRRADDTEITIYDCTDANYDWFDELNSN